MKPGKNVPSPERAARKHAFSAALAESGLSGQEAADLLGLDVRSVNRYLNEEDPTSPKALYVEKLLARTKRPGTSAGDGAHSQPVALVVKAFDVTAGAGSMGGLVISEREIGSYYLDELEVEDLLEGGGMPHEPFTFRMIGESMEPEFRDGDRLIIEPFPLGTQKIIASGIYVFRLEDSIEVKQLERRPRRRLVVSALNTRYGTYELVLDEGVDFEIIGRVRGRFKRY